MKNNSDYICSTIRFVSSDDTKIKESKMLNKNVNSVKRVGNYIVVAFFGIVMFFSCKGNDVIDNAEVFNAQANKLRGSIETVKANMNPLAFDLRFRSSAREIGRYPWTDIMDTAYICIPTGEGIQAMNGTPIALFDAVGNMITEAKTTITTPQK